MRGVSGAAAPSWSNCCPRGKPMGQAVPGRRTRVSIACPQVLKAEFAAGPGITRSSLVEGSTGGVKSPSNPDRRSRRSRRHGCRQPGTSRKVCRLDRSGRCAANRPFPTLCASKRLQAADQLVKETHLVCSGGKGECGVAAPGGALACSGSHRHVGTALPAWHHPCSSRARLCSVMLATCAAPLARARGGAPFGAGYRVQQHGHSGRDPQEPQVSCACRGCVALVKGMKALVSARSRKPSWPQHSRPWSRAGWPQRSEWAPCWSCWRVSRGRGRSPRWRCCW